jgi:hypothetical protein
MLTVKDLRDMLNGTPKEYDDAIIIKDADIWGFVACERIEFTGVEPITTPPGPKGKFGQFAIGKHRRAVYIK